MKVRVVRVLIYEGDMRWMKVQIEKSIQGTKIVQHPQFGEQKIHAYTMGEIPEVISPED